MDFLTHTLVAAGAARLIAADPRQRPQASLAAVLGALLIDGDPWLYLIDPAWYGKYHRILTHSLLGMAAMALLCAGLARLAARWLPLRRFGWFVGPNLPLEDAPAEPAPWRLLLLCALAAVGLHWLLDVITGFGNMLPFWPWSSYDASLAAVFSFDPFIFPFTIAWHLLIRHVDRPRRQEAWITAGYAACVGSYVLVRFLGSVRTYF